MPQIASFVVTGFFAIALVGSPETAVAQGQNLPPCPGNPNLVWDDCFGTYLYANGNKYVGEFRLGFRHGEGTLMSANGTVIRQGLWLNGDPVNGE